MIDSMFSIAGAVESEASESEPLKELLLDEDLLIIKLVFNNSADARYAIVANL